MTYAGQDTAEQAAREQEAIRLLFAEAERLRQEREQREREDARR